MSTNSQRYRRHRFPPEIISHRYAAKRFFRKLLKGQRSKPRWLITDKLRSCGGGASGR